MIDPAAAPIPFVDPRGTMATRVTLTTPESDETDSTIAINEADPTVRVSKVKLTNDRGDRRAEAAWLWRAARPGIVPIESPPPPDTSTDGAAVGHLTEGADPPGFTIVTAHMGSRTLRTARLEPEATRRALVEVAELLVGLHRDGLVHGKITPDHVILGAERVWLCSPDGNASDPADDLDGLARCMNDAQRQWTDRPGWSPLSSSSFQKQWTDLAERIADSDDASRSAIRALAGLRRLPTTISLTDGQESDAASPRQWRRPTLSAGHGLAVAALFVCGAIGGLAIAPEGRSAASGPRLEINGSIYAVGSAGDDLVMLDQPCDPDAPVFVLEAGTETVWAFDRIGDGERARAVAVVPGVTDLRQEWVDGDEPCTHLVARGPAGATIIDPNL